MSFSKDDAVQKVFATPELIEKILPFLDAGSIKHLAEAHGLTLEVLGKALIWDKLVKRTFPVDHEDGVVGDGTVLEANKANTRGLAEVVKLTKNSKTKNCMVL